MRAGIKVGPTKHLLPVPVSLLPGWKQLAGSLELGPLPVHPMSIDFLLLTSPGASTTCSPQQP